MYSEASVGGEEAALSEVDLRVAVLIDEMHGYGVPQVGLEGDESESLVQCLLYTLH